MLCVYVAGKYSANSVLGVFENMRLGMQMSAKLLHLGYAVYSPWMDYHFNLMSPEGEMCTLEMLYENGLAWLEVSDILFVMLDSKDSVGVQQEIAFANAHGIPVVLYDVFELLKRFPPEGPDATP